MNAKITESAIACPRSSCPGVLRSLYITRGAVRVSGFLGRNEVAPNSPKDMAKEKPAPTRSERSESFKSILNQLFIGFTPRSWEFSYSNVGIRRIVGTTLLITNGIPNRA